jgi:hypothetical protein
VSWRTIGECQPKDGCSEFVYLEVQCLSRNALHRPIANAGAARSSLAPMAICPFATWDEINGPVGNYVGGPYRIVHHTTEGNSYASARAAYSANRCDPHFTVDPVTIFQHIDTSLSARALHHDQQDPETNRLSAISIELVAFAGQPKSAGTLANVAALCRWLESTHGIPQDWPNGYPNPPLNGQDPGGHNRNLANWLTLGGHYGHCHVPANTHWDPAYTLDEVHLVMARQSAVLLSAALAIKASRPSPKKSKSKGVTSAKPKKTSRRRQAGPRRAK